MSSISDGSERGRLNYEAIVVLPQNRYCDDMDVYRLRETVSASLGWPVTLTKISGYLNRSEIYVVSECEAVVKVYHHAASSKFSRERSAYAILNSSGVPHASVIAMSESDAELLWICMSFLPGSSAEAFPFCESQADKVFGDIGRIAQQLHKVAYPVSTDIDKIVIPGSDLLQEYAAKYRRYFQSSSMIEDDYQELRARGAEMLESFVRHSTSFKTPPKFVHGDFSSRNVMVHGDSSDCRISGVLDFERSQFGDPAQDLATIWFKDLSTDPLKLEFCFEGYGQGESRLRDRILFHFLGLMFEIASWAYERDFQYYSTAMRKLEAVIDGEIALPELKES